MNAQPLRLLVVDDTGLYRKLLRDTLVQIDGVEVVGTASNGSLALSKLSLLEPDLLTLDVEMPMMDGLETLRQLRQVAPTVGVIMVSAHTNRGAKVTMEALELGAFDFIAKPEGNDLADNLVSLRRQLHPIIAAWRNKKRLKPLLDAKDTPARPPERTITTPAQPRAEEVIQRMRALSRSAPIALVALGVSTGGPQALAHLIPRLPQDLGVPVVVVQHMPPMFTAALANQSKMAHPSRRKS